MAGPVGRSILGILSLGALGLGYAWIKFELIDKDYPGPWWPAVVWIGGGLVLGYAALRGFNGRRAQLVKAGVLVAAALAIALFALVVYAISELDS